MKVCDCGKKCPDDEEGDIVTEFYADSTAYKEYWICDHMSWIIRKLLGMLERLPKLRIWIAGHWRTI